ncbi:hypothetical protein [Rhizobium yanglingense]
MRNSSMKVVAAEGGLGEHALDATVQTPVVFLAKGRRRHNHDRHRP